MRSTIDYTDEELLNTLKQFYINNGRQPVQSDAVGSSVLLDLRRYKKRFGSWNNAIQLAGLQPITKRKSLSIGKRYTDDELLAAIKNFHTKHGRIPTLRDTENSSELPTRRPFENIFGSWKNAIRLAGFNPILHGGPLEIRSKINGIGLTRKKRLIALLIKFLHRVINKLEKIIK